MFSNLYYQFIMSSPKIINVTVVNYTLEGSVKQDAIQYPLQFLQNVSRTALDTYKALCVSKWVTIIWRKKITTEEAGKKNTH